ncbi:condensation domain-containing protein [Amycolatopsis rubida]|uniref:Condensation domain-containing protein n=1 Tax=Amycolatopsis rubida TaxID=112413 RepID=A0A1I5LQ26_9PSEU|nr:condensation domain-containing protein [Amycolatopsis rubida]SFO99263.1 Condensation domain-containing protein [Amycolatopsis rubida]
MNTRPLSVFQRAMLDCGPDFTGQWFTMNAVLRLSAPLDPDVLSAALTNLIARHEILRTRVTDEAQVVSPPGPPVFEVHQGSDPADWLHAPVPPESGPLVVRLVRGDPGLLAVHLHHLVADPGTVWAVCRELAALYSAELGGPAPPMPAAQYGDYAAAEARQRRTTEAGDRAWWETAMARDFVSVRKDENGPPYAERATLLPKAGLAAVHRFARTHRTTPATTLFAALACAMRPWTGPGPRVFTTVFGLRDRPEWRRMLGPCLLTAYVPLPAPPSRLTPEYAVEVRDVLRDCRRHCRFPMPEVRAFRETPDAVPFYEYVPDDWPEPYEFGPVTAQVVAAAGPKDTRAPTTLAIRSRSTAEGTVTAHVSSDGRGWSRDRVRSLWPAVAGQVGAGAAPDSLR